MSASQSGEKEISIGSASMSEDGVWCVICQAAMHESESTPSIQTPTPTVTATMTMRKHTSKKKNPLIVQLKENHEEVSTPDYVRIRETRTANPDPLDVATLACGHTYHRLCLLRWLHYNNDSCPLCRGKIDITGPLAACVWKVKNIAVRTKCSPESIRLGLRPDGWFNVQLQVEPPPHKQIRRVRYIFHPAFSLNKLDIDTPPFDLVMKLVSNSVDLLIEVTCTDGSVFTMVHMLLKEMCTRVYFEGIFNGVDSSHIKGLTYFNSLLETYHRDKDYYGAEMDPPPRFAERNQQKGNPITRFFHNMFNH
ncbi:Ribonuclease [Giardia muris]|uniref:Ribonuclease n=1 Tax=Giardia muris TaxID=5742 RepID=A0A4Z1SY12_GIAMU|nr:Ribonuclease [Giardia muris]|eukprot:TNJ30642.1 Ribonuclease [Giardia muris]